MSIVSHLLVFIVAWWLVLFMVLPFGVKNHFEADELDHENGIEHAAPVKPQMLKKVLITTIIAFIIWGIYYVVATSGLITVR